MRKNNIFIVAFMMLLALASASYAEKGKYSISELYHEYHGQRWQADYETVRNETICVDLEISVPQADAIHVLSARYMPNRMNRVPRMNQDVICSSRMNQAKTMVVTGFR